MIYILLLGICACGIGTVCLGLENRDILVWWFAWLIIVSGAVAVVMSIIAIIIIIKETMMDTKEPTICMKCKHCLDGEEPRFFTCAIAPQDKWVTGEPLRYSFCVIKNLTGTCPDYEEADDE